ncbi:CheR family methyltransferase [Tautonia marina]|uniref:CheR family methyltransferase n=1 Tax=Tautonia marina TaxID=2653855 RepID=UPI001260BFCF|nr:protein-glutamate O-methyltransferase CheR [Tautonia marina]
MSGPASDPDLDAAERVLGERIGLNPDSLGRGPIAQAVASRRKALGMGEGDYAKVLSDLEDERQALVEEVVVPESWFFRDQLPFAHLAGVIAPGWRNTLTRPPLRLLCAPCAGGEEPYSVVITLLETGLTPDRFQVVAVDVSRRELERARSGVYRAHSFRGIDAAVRDRYFERAGADWRITSPAVDLVEWRQGNLLDPVLPDALGTYDVVFCRNLLIYFHDDAKRRAVAALKTLVTPGGTLFVGHAEAGLLHGPDFRPSRSPGAFAFLRASADLPGATNPSPSRTPQRVDGAGETSGPRSAPGFARSSLTGSTATPQISSIRPLSARFEEQSMVPETVDRVSELANQGAWESALAMAGRLVSRSPSDPSAYVLLGSIEQAAGRADRAEACYRRAVYLDGDRVEALLALAGLVDARGDRIAAANYRRRADRAARRGNGS